MLLPSCFQLAQGLAAVNFVERTITRTAPTARTARGRQSSDENPFSTDAVTELLMDDVLLSLCPLVQKQDNDDESEDPFGMCPLFDAPFALSYGPSLNLELLILVERSSCRMAEESKELFDTVDQLLFRPHPEEKALLLQQQQQQQQDSTTSVAAAAAAADYKHEQTKIVTQKRQRKRGRRVVKTRKVPRKTMLSDISNYEQDLDETFFRNMLEEVRLPTFYWEEYSEYEQDDDDEDEEQQQEDDGEYAQAIIEMPPLSPEPSTVDPPAAPLLRRQTTNWVFGSLRLPKQHYSSEKLGFGAFSLNEVRFAFVALPKLRQRRLEQQQQQIQQRRPPKIALMNLEYQQCSLEDLNIVALDKVYTRRIKERQRREYDPVLWGAATYTGIRNAPTVNAFLSLLQPQLQYPFSTVGGAGDIVIEDVPMYIDLCIELDTPQCSLEALTSEPLDDVYFRRIDRLPLSRGQQQQQQQPVVVPDQRQRLSPEAKLSNVKELDQDLSDDVFAELLKKLSEDVLVDVDEKEEKYEQVSRTGTDEEKEDYEMLFQEGYKDWEELNDDDVKLLCRYMALREAVGEQDWAELDEEEVEPLLRRDDDDTPNASLVTTVAGVATEGTETDRASDALLAREQEVSADSFMQQQGEDVVVPTSGEVSLEEDISGAMAVEEGARVVEVHSSKAENDSIYVYTDSEDERDANFALRQQQHAIAEVQSEADFDDDVNADAFSDFEVEAEEEVEMKPSYFTDESEEEESPDFVVTFGEVAEDGEEEEGSVELKPSYFSDSEEEEALDVDDDATGLQQHATVESAAGNNEGDIEETEKLDVDVTGSTLAVAVAESDEVSDSDNDVTLSSEEVSVSDFVNAVTGNAIVDSAVEDSDEEVDILAEAEDEKEVLELFPNYYAASTSVVAADVNGDEEEVEVDVSADLENQEESRMVISVDLLDKSSKRLDEATEEEEEVLGEDDEEILNPDDLRVLREGCDWEAMSISLLDDFEAPVDDLEMLWHRFRDPNEEGDRLCNAEVELLHESDANPVEEDDGSDSFQQEEGDGDVEDTSSLVSPR